MRIIDHGFMNKIPMLYICDATKWICLLLLVQNTHSVLSHPHLLIHLLTHTQCAILFRSHFLSLGQRWAVVSLWHTHSRTCESKNIHAQSTYYPFCSFGPVHKKSFGWFRSLVLVFKHRHICESAKVNSYSLLTAPHHTTKRKRTMCSNWFQR